MESEEKYKPPEPELQSKDYKHAIARGVLGIIPWAGAPAAEMFSLLVNCIY